MQSEERILISGDEAVALAARDGHVRLGTGYPGTPSTEILEKFSELGGQAQWSANEKVALEVAIGAAFAGARAICTMKHVGLNVAADPLFTVAYTGVQGALVIVSADDPGMSSSQNEQDNRRYAVAAGVPMLEPADSQEAYDFTLLAIQTSERWQIPVLLRMTTRVCHSYAVVRPRPQAAPPAPPHFERDVRHRVMIPAYARPAHVRLREKLHSIAGWNEADGPNRVVGGAGGRGIITSGISYMHVREAAPDAAVLKLGMTHPLPLAAMREFARTHGRAIVIEEGDPYLADAALAAGIALEPRPALFRFGELNVDRVRRILSGDDSPEPKLPAGKAPELCPGCPHRSVFTALRDLGSIVAGDIGCYTLGVLPPFNALDTCVCMGAGITVGLGLRKVLPQEEARRVVSVIGDSTFLHSGITGLVDAVYNPPPAGHLTIILDNGTTAMTGMQEHPGTGRSLDHRRAGKVVIERLVESLGIEPPVVIDPTVEPARFQSLVEDALGSGAVRVIIARRNCLLATSKIKSYEQALKEEACIAFDE
jgi:indolepyruvate ferredoxin oxidoreductase, alpha subunit